MKSIATVTLLAFLLPLLGHAQVYNIGDTKEAVRKALGRPQHFYSVPFNRLFEPEEEAFAVSAGKTDDVWEVKTARNSFEVRATYKPDPSSSRLHPTERLAVVTLIPDKDEVASQLLEQISISRIICMEGCEVFGQRRGPGYLEVWVCRRPVNQIDGRTPAGSYLGWGSYDPEGVYVRCSEIHYGQHPELGNVSIAKIDWKSLKVDQITVSGDDLRYLGDGGKEGLNWVRLAQWTTPNN